MIILCIIKIPVVPLSFVCIVYIIYTKCYRLKSYMITEKSFPRLLFQLRLWWNWKCIFFTFYFQIFVNIHEFKWKYRTLQIKLSVVVTVTIKIFYTYCEIVELKSNIIYTYIFGNTNGKQLFSVSKFYEFSTGYNKNIFNTIPIIPL